MDMEYLTTTQVAELMGVTPSAVYGWCHRGLLPCEKPKGRWCIPADAAKAFVKPQQGGPRTRPGYHILTDEEVAEVRRLAPTMRNKDLARMYRASEAAISRIVRGERRCDSAA